jgi:hypothetical protein
LNKAMHVVGWAVIADWIADPSNNHIIRSMIKWLDSPCQEHSGRLEEL